MMKRQLVRLGIAVVLVTAVVPGVASLAAVAGAQDDAAVARQFLGMWRLVDWTQRGADGATRPGQTDVGYLVYTDVNRMCAVMMDSKRPQWTPAPPASVDQAVARFSGFISYCARVEVHAREGFVLHHVDVERSPNIVGTVRKRWFSFEGANRLTLKIDAAELGATVKESTLVWERMRD
jgi:hypothetical protein